MRQAPAIVAELQPLAPPAPDRPPPADPAPRPTVTIGSVEVTVVPPPPPPAPAPAAVPRPVGPLARGFVTTFGLRQG
jgi:hypothetical protein